MNTTSQYLIAVTIIWQHLVHSKLQYDPNKQLTKRGALREPYQKITQKSFLSHTDRMTEPTRITICSLMRILVLSNLTQRLPTPSAQNTIYVITQSQIVMTTTDIDSVPQPSTERIRTLSGNPRNVFWN